MRSRAMHRWRSPRNRAMDRWMRRSWCRRPAQPARARGAGVGDLAELDERPPRREEIAGQAADLVRHLIGLGIGGFRCRAACAVPAWVWRRLIDAARSLDPEIVFCAETQ